MGDAESDVVDSLLNTKNKRHKISPSPTREKGNGLGEGADSGLEESSEEEYVGSDEDNFGF